MKKLLLFPLFFSFLVSSNSNAALTKIREESVRMSSALSAVKLLHNQDKFVVSDDEGLHEIDNCWLDSDLRRLASNPEALEKFQDVGTIEIKKDEKGLYLLRSHVRGLGGGLGGASLGFTIGKYGTYLVGHGTIVVASAMTGWGCLATFMALEAQFAAPIEAASNTIALGTGMIGAVATGPV